MTFRRYTISLLILVATLVLLLGAVSFFRPFSANVSPSQRTWFQFVITEGNLRAIFARGPAERIAPPQPPHRDAAEPPPLDEVKLFWQRALFVALPLRVRHYARVDPSESRFGAYEVRLDLSTFILGPLLLFLAWLLGPGRRLLAHLPGILREIWKPSDGRFLWPVSRLARRTVVAAMGFAACAAMVLLVVDVLGPGTLSPAKTWHPKFLGARVQSVSIGGGSVAMTIEANPDAPGVIYRRHWPGFHLETNVARVSSNSGSLPPGISLENPLAPAIQAFLKQLQYWTAAGTLVHTISLDLWVPLIFLVIYPVIALIRGPIRRYRRRAKGQCLTCAYNLTGLIEPRCPECGTSFVMRQATQPVADGSATV